MIAEAPALLREIAAELDCGSLALQVLKFERTPDNGVITTIVIATKTPREAIP